MVAVILACGAMKAKHMAALSSFPAALWLPYDFAWNEESLFSTTTNIRVTVRGVPHQVSLPVSTSTLLQCSPTTWDTARAAAFTFLSVRFTASTTSPSRSHQVSPAAGCLSLFAPPLLSSTFLKDVHLAFPFIPGVPTYVPPVITAATVAATPPVSSVITILAGILAHAHLRWCLTFLFWHLPASLLLLLQIMYRFLQWFLLLL